MTSSNSKTTSTTSEPQKELAPETVHAVNTFMAYLAKENLPGITRVLLYGSRARGDFDPESDINLAVIFETPVQEDDRNLALRRLDLQRHLSGIRGDAMSDTEMEVFAFAIWEEELREPDKHTNPALFHNINRDGIDTKDIV